MFKSIIICAVVCLSVGLVLAAPTAEGPATGVEQKPGFNNLVCDACKSVVEQVQANMPQVRPQLDQLCNYCGSPEADQKCRDKLHELEDKVEHTNPRDVCVMVGLCRPHAQNDPKTFYDFSGQF